MEAFFLVVLLTAVSFVAGAVYGRGAEAKAIALVMKAEAEVDADIHNAVVYFRNRIASLRAHL